MILFSNRFKKALKKIEKEAGKELKNNLLKGLDKLFK